jgi:hypothetical protein
MSVDKRTDQSDGADGVTRKRPYASPRLTEYGSVAKLTQGTRSVQQDGPGATAFKKDSCL